MGEQEMTTGYTTYQKKKSATLRRSTSQLIYSLFQLANRPHKEKVFGPFSIAQKSKEPMPLLGDFDRKKSLIFDDFRFNKRDSTRTPKIELNRFSSMQGEGSGTLLRRPDQPPSERPGRSMSHTINIH